MGAVEDFTPAAVDRSKPVPLAEPKRFSANNAQSAATASPSRPGGFSGG